ncbi:MAG: PQQ-dependent sugar dehydrogenase [Archangium sp.]
MRASTRFVALIAASLISGCVGLVGEPEDAGAGGGEGGGAANGGGAATGGGGGGATGGGATTGGGGGATGGGAGGGGATGGGGGAATGGGGGAAMGGGGGAAMGGGGGAAMGGGGGAAMGGGGGTVSDGGLGLDQRPPNPTCVAPNPPPGNSPVTTRRVFPNLTFNAPLGMFNAPNDTTRVFVQERDGFIRVFPNNNNAMPNQVTTFLDFSSRVDTNGEGGFLGMAFHPNWPTTLEVFISYTETNGPNLRTVIARYKSMDSGATLSFASEERLFSVDHNYTNHKGGNIAFGPDGFLYIGIGDGGSGGDPNNSGQSLNTTLGKMLRIDVNVPFATKYAIPPTNPYAADNTPCNRTVSTRVLPAGTRCGEIYAYGFRNPWRWSFDTVTGELWVGDVGQDAYEEVDRVLLGGNYGWRYREGKHCYSPSSNCPTAGLIDPVVEYDRSVGNSMTGGFVYRGTAIPSLVGKFVFGDYGSGRVLNVEPDGMGGFNANQLFSSGMSIGSFAQLANGEVYILDIASGEVHQLVVMGMDAGVSTFPQLLSQTGCFQQSDPKLPVAGLIPYDVNAALWSDGAAKERFFAIPDGTTINLTASGDFDFPNGTVLAKTFSLGGKRIETRLFMKHMSGTWAGYSYEWNAAETEATLLPAGKSKVVGTQTWFFPSRGQCMICHTAIAGRSLGLEIGQLNRDFTYAATGRTANEVDTLAGLGFFTTAPSGPASGLTRYEPPFGTGPLEDRARAYLHANCAGCHQQGVGQGPADWRYSLTFMQTNACNAMPTAGTLGVGTAARLIAPGSPMNSIVSLRMHAMNSNRMPPLATSIEDTMGTSLIDSWISSLSTCP